VNEPEAFLTELFRAWHGLLAVRRMGALSGAIYARMTPSRAYPPMTKPW
jgi:magnesium transporter